MLVVGALGRMGERVRAALAEQDELVLAAAVEARPTLNGWLQLGAVQMDLKQYKEAEASLEAGAKMTKRNFRLTELRARLYIETERWDKAADKYEEIAKKFPRDGTPRYLRGLCFMQLERGGEAAASFQEVLEKDPFHKGAIRNLIKLWKDDPSHRGDVSDLEKRLEMIKKKPPRVRRVSGKNR